MFRIYYFNIYGSVYLTTGCERTQPVRISIKGPIKNDTYNLVCQLCIELLGLKIKVKLIKSNKSNNKNNEDNYTIFICILL